MRFVKLGIRITPEQNKLLLEKARNAGYIQVSEFVRSILFREKPIEEKINAIYEKVCKNG